MCVGFALGSSRAADRCALHDEIADELRKRGEDVEGQAPPGRGGLSASCSGWKPTPALLQRAIGPHRHPRAPPGHHRTEHHRPGIGPSQSPWSPARPTGPMASKQAIAQAVDSHPRAGSRGVRWAINKRATWRTTNGALLMIAVTKPRSETPSGPARRTRRRPRRRNRRRDRTVLARRRQPAHSRRSSYCRAWPWVSRLGPGRRLPTHAAGPVSGSAQVQDAPAHGGPVLVPAGDGDGHLAVQVQAVVVEGANRPAAVAGLAAPAPLLIALQRVGVVRLQVDGGGGCPGGRTC